MKRVGNHAFGGLGAPIRSTPGPFWLLSKMSPVPEKEGNIEPFPCGLCPQNWQLFKGCRLCRRPLKVKIFGLGQMEANGCVQRLDLVEMFIMGVSKLKNDVKMVNLFNQARSTCLPWPSLLVYPGLANLFTQAWSTCLPRPGIFSRFRDTLENIDFVWISSFIGSPGFMRREAHEA